MIKRQEQKEDGRRLLIYGNQAHHNSEAQQHLITSLKLYQDLDLSQKAEDVNALLTELR